MSMTSEDARFVAEARLAIVKNMQAGKPASSGIDKARLRQALELIREDRTLGEASKSKKAAENVVPINLSDFMKGK